MISGFQYFVISSSSVALCRKPFHWLPDVFSSDILAGLLVITIDSPSQFASGSLSLRLASKMDLPAFQMGQWTLSVSCMCDLAPTWFNSNTFKRAWKLLCGTVAVSVGWAAWNCHASLGSCGRRNMSTNQGRPSSAALLKPMLEIYPQSFWAKNANDRKISQSSASARSFWSKRSIRSCSREIPDVFVLEKTHPLNIWSTLL